MHLLILHIDLVGEIIGSWDRKSNGRDVCISKQVLSEYDFYIQPKLNRKKTTIHFFIEATLKE